MSKQTNYCCEPTLLWWIEARLQAVEELIKAQLPVGVLIRELDEGVDTQAPGKHKYTCKQNKYLLLRTVTTEHKQGSIQKKMIISLDCLIPRLTVVYASAGSASLHWLDRHQ